MKLIFTHFCFFAVVVTTSGWLIENKNDIKINDKYEGADKVDSYRLHYGNRMTRSSESKEDTMKETSSTQSEDTTEGNIKETETTISNEAFNVTEQSGDVSTKVPENTRKRRSDDETVTSTSDGNANESGEKIGKEEEAAGNDIAVSNATETAPKEAEEDQKQSNGTVNE